MGEAKANYDQKESKIAVLVLIWGAGSLSPWSCLWCSVDQPGLREHYNLFVFWGETRRVILVNAFVLYKTKHFSHSMVFQALFTNSVYFLIPG